MNVQLFAMPEAAYYNPTAYGDLEGANLYVWLGGRLLADQKFMTIFSMLFGAGIVLMTTRAEARGETHRVHYRRMGWLALIGLLHAHLLWAGDILFLYAVCGMLVYPFRGLSPGRLLVVGTATVAVASAIFAGLQASLPSWPEEALAEVTLGAWQPTRAIVDDALATYRGGWLEQLPARSAMAFGFETFMLVIWGGWRAGGLMLIGMALFKLDVFSAGRSRRFYGALVAAALVAGIPVEAYGVALDFEYGWALDWSLLQGRQFNYWPSIAVGLGYVGLVMLACRSTALRRATRPFAAVGQTALSNYLLQTVICTTIFYGHGLGLYGSVDRVGQLGVVLGVWAVQLIASPLWLRRYRFGPAEWVWRSLTYGARPPLRRAAGPAR
ncbi:MAG: DUF418 domain-containing protein [Acidobacteria bacterium]|nr:DUF418 domain-containing protein [Acidobacteriota bacterium]MYH31857.1 DUF418 domain-containing protein [Acidobacteriota bacterium]